MTSEDVEDVEDEAFGELLRSIARTPDVSGLRRDIGPGSELLDRFVIGRQMGEGGMGRVFAAFDRVRQARVAIKMLGVLTPHSITALKREFRVAEKLVHPNLVRLYELFSDGEEWFFTMELLEGVTVRRLLAKRQSLDVQLFRHIFGQLAQGLAELHRTGTLHGDLKPSNFLIVGVEQRVILLDFGVSRPLGQVAPGHALGGTHEYCAPEQFSQLEVTEAADWYSFGVVLFEALTGKLPSRPLEPELWATPPELAQLCVELLHEAPELRATSEVVRRALGELGPQQPTSPPSWSGRHRLIGRAREREQLLEAYDRVGPGRPQVVVVRGDSGMGKTALMEHFVRTVAHRGAIVLSSRCRERESTSYKAVDGLIDDLVKYLDELPREEAARLLPDGIEELTRLFPTLRTATAIVAHSPRGSLDGSDQSLVKRKAILAFRDLLVAISERAKLVVWIDDLQWSDAHSAALLEPILVAAKPCALMLLGGSRSMGGLRGLTIDVLYAQSTSALPEPLLVDLAPLLHADAAALARELLPPQAGSQAWAQDIAREADGSPLFITELVHQRGAAGSSGLAGGAQTLNELVRNRVRKLSDEARGLLEATALAGIPLSRTAARRSQGLTPHQTEEAIDLLRVSRLIRTAVGSSGDERNIEMHHDRIREIVLQGSSPEVKRAQHLRLARALVAERSVQPEILATHFFAGGEPIQAGRYWLGAADAAFAALAFSHAAELYGRAASYAELDSVQLGAVQAKQAEALAYDGKGTAAADVYLAAAAGQTQEQAIELRRRAAEQLLLCGHLERGLQVIGLVLRGLKMRGTRTGHRVLLSILLGRLLVRLRGLRFKPRTASEISQRELARVDASWSIACSMGVIDFLRGVDFQNDHLLLALKAGEPRRLLRALTLEISYAATPGRGSQHRTTELLSMANGLAEQVDDPAAAGLVHVSRGVAAYLNGRFDEALVECQSGVHGMRRYSGMIWETVTAQRFIVASLFHLGRLRALAELVPPLLSEAVAKGNLYASVFFRTTYSNAAWLVADDVPAAREQLKAAASEWRAPGTQLPHCWLLVGQANLAFYTGETAELWRRIEPEWQRLVSAQFMRIGMVRIQLWQLRCWAALAEARMQLQKERPREAQRFNQEARRCAAQVGKQRMAFAKPLGGLALAAADGATGDLSSARARLADCIESFTAQGMLLYAAAARARLGELRGGDDGAALVRQSEEAFAAEGIVSFRGMLNLLSPGFVR